MRKTLQKYKFDEQPNTIIKYKETNMIDRITNGPYSCLIGPNNSGKSFLLKKIALDIGETATYLGPARYNNFNALAPYAPKKNRRSQWFQQFRQQFQTSNQNIDNSPFNVQQAIAELDDDRRSRLFRIVKIILGVELSLELSFPENEMSQRYISCDGHNLSYASSGTRLLVSIVTSLLDHEYSYFLIDEPELGVSPKSQGEFADFILNPEIREKFFPHIKSIIFATHSAVFLDRRNINHNFTIEKSSDTITIDTLNSLSDFNQIHFALLGNRLENLFLPSAVLFVEGPTEQKFISQVLKTRCPNLNVSIINSTNDSEMKRYAHMMSQIFPDLQRSPYNGRIIPILDSVHGGGIIEALEKKGINKEDIVTWSKNGIEFYYPDEIMREIFGGFGPISIIGDEVTMCGTTLRKTTLCDRVCERIDVNSKYPDEFENKFMSKLNNL